MPFPPIAIIGQGCVLPGALDPGALWSLVRSGRSALSTVTDSLWRLAPNADLERLAREVPSRTGGYVRGFEAAFDPRGFQVAPESLIGLDEVVLWPLHAARQALVSAGLDPMTAQHRGIVVLGNLGYPTASLVDLALEIWAKEPARVDRRNRFMSGLPAQLVAQAVGFNAGAFALDAACASSLYAIKLACDRLHDGSADLALAGGVNHADDLFLHAGFAALRALSPTGQSRPFHREADGLVPAQGAAIVLLKRLPDALSAGDTILGLIRGVGLTNDGRGRGLLVPGEDGQARALAATYEMAGVDPRDVSLVECHATGTSVGDGTEIRSMRRVFEGARGLPIGSLKSNMGHLVTASGAAAVLKILGAMRDRVRPPSLHATPEDLLDEVKSSPFRVLHALEQWESNGPRFAAISNFGFGGNNAHLLMEEWRPELYAAPQTARPAGPAAVEIAVIARSVLTGGPDDLDGLFVEPRAHARRVPDFELDLAGLRFPPADLKESLPQQLLLLRAAMRISSTLARLTPERTGLYVGMQTDAQIARFAMRWVHPSPPPPGPPPLSGGQLNVAAVLGCMPNILANRISHQFDLRGPCFTMSAEEASGNRALEAGMRGLAMGEIDCALVGAVDLAAEEVQEVAARATLPEARHEQGDAAVLFVLKRLEDARRDGDPVLAVLTNTGRQPGLALALSGDEPGLTPMLGHAHAAAGLAHVAAAVDACARRAIPTPKGPQPWLPSGGGRRARVDVEPVLGAAVTTWLRAEGPPDHPVFTVAPPCLAVFAAENMDDLAHAVAAREAGGAGAFRLAVVAGSLDGLQERCTRAVTQLHAALRVDGTGAAASQHAHGSIALGDGAWLGVGPMPGELGFVFTGPAGAYTRMGRELALAIPELVDGLGARMRSLREAAGWVYDAEPGYQAEPIDKLWGASYLAQLHTEFTRRFLKLRATASIGYCSGETNALFAMGAWNDMDAFRRAVEDSQFYTDDLCGELTAVKTAWGLPDGARVDWAIWRLRAPLGEVQAAVANEPRVHVTIINAAADVIIGGDAAGCQRVVAPFGPRASRVSGYDFVMHCPEARERTAKWRALHHRPVTPVPGVRFYTHATLASYTVTDDAAADALTGQAMNTVDFPSLIERAYADGVRVFVEHGPHGGCTKWIDDTLGARPHVAIALDRYGTSSLAQCVEGAARLYAAGVAVDLSGLMARLSWRAADSTEPRSAHHLRVVAHPTPPALAPRR